MPFGLDLKSIILGILLALVVWPMLSGMLASRKTATQ